ncbi:hypothetical protein EDEG_02709 [Edhazardia aedis USNM 41457]|uniref:Uncharacterized protein n=1 Tax=Edhazardia aedis (strain USNM 41457) TaxID=1003232 RepID=J9DJT7_EDHAE|nr:hypothetical protein EDEG_02709 [Edhazardia aedis USNM 41457]|eukprot:EJW02885.1 hypothetical protein EDEG_02709 [Edhazardia aedis USNM 41457]
MSIVFVDPQDVNEKHWWVAIIVDPTEHERFFDEMGERIDLGDDHLVCFFDDASYGRVKKEEVMLFEEYFKMYKLERLLKKSVNDLPESEAPPGLKSTNEIDLIVSAMNLDKDEVKWINSRSIKAALKLYRDGKPPVKFKWLKKCSTKGGKKRKDEDDPGFRKKVLLSRAMKVYKDIF